jgi:hypothetical protein
MLQFLSKDAFIMGDVIWDTSNATLTPIYRPPLILGGGDSTILNVSKTFGELDPLLPYFKSLLSLDPNSKKFGNSLSIQALPPLVSLGSTAPAPHTTCPGAWGVSFAPVNENQFHILSYVVKNIMKRGLFVTVDRIAAGRVAHQLLSEVYRENKSSTFRYGTENSHVQPNVKRLTEIILAFGNAVAHGPTQTPIYEIDLRELRSMGGFSPYNNVDVTVDIQGEGAFHSSKKLAGTTASRFKIEPPPTGDFMVSVRMHDSANHCEVCHTEFFLGGTSVQRLRDENLLNVNGRLVCEVIPAILRSSSVWEGMLLTDRYLFSTRGEVTDDLFPMLGQFPCDSLSASALGKGVTLESGGRVLGRQFGVSAHLVPGSQIASLLADLTRSGASGGVLPWEGLPVESVVFSTEIVVDQFTPGAPNPAGTPIPAGQARGMYPKQFTEHFERPLGGASLRQSKPLLELYNILVGMAFTVDGDARAANAVADEALKAYSRAYNVSDKVRAMNNLLKELQRVGAVGFNDGIVGIRPCLKKLILDFMKGIGSAAPLQSKLNVNPSGPHVIPVVCDVPNGDYPESPPKGGLLSGSRVLLVASYDSVHKEVHYEWIVVSEHQVSIKGRVQEAMQEALDSNALDPIPFLRQLITGTWKPSTEVTPPRAPVKYSTSQQIPNLTLEKGCDLNDDVFVGGKVGLPMASAGCSLDPNGPLVGVLGDIFGGPHPIYTEEVPISLEFRPFHSGRNGGVYPDGQKIRLNRPGAQSVLKTLSNKGVRKGVGLFSSASVEVGYERHSAHKALLGVLAHAVHGSLWKDLPIGEQQRIENDIDWLCTRHFGMGDQQVLDAVEEAYKEAVKLYRVTETSVRHGSRPPELFVNSGNGWAPADPAGFDGALSAKGAVVLARSDVGYTCSFLLPPSVIGDMRGLKSVGSLLPLLERALPWLKGQDLSMVFTGERPQEQYTLAPIDAPPVVPPVSFSYETPSDPFSSIYITHPPARNTRLSPAPFSSSVEKPFASLLFILSVEEPLASFATSFSRGDPSSVSDFPSGGTPLPLTLAGEGSSTGVPVLLTFSPLLPPSGEVTLDSGGSDAGALDRANGSWDGLNVDYTEILRQGGDAMVSVTPIVSGAEGLSGAKAEGVVSDGFGGGTPDPRAAEAEGPPVEASGVTMDTSTESPALADFTFGAASEQGSDGAGPSSGLADAATFTSVGTPGARGAPSPVSIKGIVSLRKETGAKATDALVFGKRGDPAAKGKELFGGGYGQQARGKPLFTLVDWHGKENRDAKGKRLFGDDYGRPIKGALLLPISGVDSEGEQEIPSSEEWLEGNWARRAL